jgi:hypothetical protein
VKWQRAHWWAGLVGLALFLSAAVFMRYVIQVPLLPDAPRMIYRSRFLFLLLAAIANLGVSGVRPVSVIERMASAVILAAPFSLAVSFLVDAGRGTQSSPWTVWTMRSLFGAALLLAFAHRPRRGTR